MGVKWNPPPSDVNYLPRSVRIYPTSSITFTVDYARAFIVAYFVIDSSGMFYVSGLLGDSLTTSHAQWYICTDSVATTNMTNVMVDRLVAAGYYTTT